MNKQKYYRAQIKENQQEKIFDSISEIKVWASNATNILQSDLTITVIECTEKEMKFNASYATGEVIRNA